MNVSTQVQETDDRDAWVICKQMGYTNGYLLHRSAVSPATSSRQIWMNDLDCAGTETHIEQCLHNNKDQWNWGTITPSTLDHTYDIGVGCDVETTATKDAA